MKKIVLTFFSLAIVVSGVVGSLFVGYRAYQESERSKQISAEIQSLQDEANRVDQENRKLGDRIEYLQSDSFREREAKRVLEYQKSGEKVVFIRERAGTPGTSPSSVVSSNDAPLVLGVSRDVESNPLRWWQEFFGKNISYE